MARCKGCGARIVWAELPNGKPVPLDPSAPVYQVLKHDAGGTPQVKLLELDQGERKAMVSHFKTCPNASDFSRSRR